MEFQGSIVGPLVFIMCTNDVPPTIHTLSEPIIFEDDTSVIIYSKYFDDFCLMSNIVLSRMSKWFTANKVALNPDKSNVITFIGNNSAQYALILVMMKSLLI
jgi:hypothetical protein